MRRVDGIEIAEAHSSRFSVRETVSIVRPLCTDIPQDAIYEPTGVKHVEVIGAPCAAWARFVGVFKGEHSHRMSVSGGIADIYRLLPALVCPLMTRSGHCGCVAQRELELGAARTTKSSRRCQFSG